MEPVSLLLRMPEFENKVPSQMSKCREQTWGEQVDMIS
jgi:hypothetical protein